MPQPNMNMDHWDAILAGLAEEDKVDAPCCAGNAYMNMEEARSTLDEVPDISIPLDTSGASDSKRSPVPSSRGDDKMPEKSTGGAK